MAESGKSAGERGSGGDNRGMRIDSSLVNELAELLTANGLNEIEVQDGERRIKVRRDHAPVAAAAPAAAPAPAAPAPAAATSEAEAAAEADEVVGEAVKSPMVGTAFLAAEPGSKPFVSVGDAVNAGDTLLIIEAMKVMNPITAPGGGIVQKILISDGQPVEFDQPLVVLG